MKLIHVQNVHCAIPEGIYYLLNYGHRQPSRNGEVMVADEPVTTLYEKPKERVIEWSLRDANPFFHLFESLWMLGGRNDVDYVSGLVGRMMSFSDDGKTLNGAYGHRWREYFGVDQLRLIIDQLTENPYDRRVVLSMWDPLMEPHMRKTSKDLPCNISVLFKVNSFSELDMMVVNRSNDIIWGAYGANAVHFSVLQEYMATNIGVNMGRYWQTSMNYHAYLETLHPLRELADERNGVYSFAENNPYQHRKHWNFMPLIKNPIYWDAELEMFLEKPDALGYTEPFFRKVAIPMWQAYRYYQHEHGAARFKAIDILIDSHACDWTLAGIDWLQRRQERWATAQDDGVSYE